MVKLMLTNKCNLRCPYCFAKDTFKSDSPEEITLMNVNKVIHYLCNNGPRIIRLLGGEPTTHSKFEEVIEMFNRYDFRMQLFTNGIVEENRTEFIKNNQHIESIIINVNNGWFYNKDELHKLVNFIENIIQTKQHVVLGYNIYEEDFNPRYMMLLAEKYHIRNLRIGFANPLCSQNKEAHNKYLTFNNLRNISSKLAEFIENGYNKGMNVGLDCVVPLCAFNDEDLGKLYRYTPINAVNFICKTNIDIGTDLKIWRCFATSNFCNDKYLTDFNNLKEILDYFNQYFFKYQQLGGLEACTTCQHHTSSKCQGGCIGYSILRS